METAQRTFHRLTLVIFQRYVTAKRDFLTFSEHSGESPRPPAAGILFRSPFLSATLLEHINQSVLPMAKLEGVVIPQRAWKLKRFSERPGEHMTTG